MSLLGNHSTHQKLTSPCLQNTSQGSCEVLNEVKSKTSEEHGVQDWTWNIYGGHRGWCNMITYNLRVFAFFLSSTVLFFSPNNNQECNRNAENQGVDYPGKAVGAKKAFFVVVFLFMAVELTEHLCLAGSVLSLWNIRQKDAMCLSLFSKDHAGSLRETFIRLFSYPVIRRRSILK